MICFLKKFTVGFYFVFFFIGVSCVWLESGFSEVQRTTQDISRNIASQLGNSLSPNQVSGIAIYDEIQNRTVTGNEIQSVLMNIANEGTAQNDVLCADILSNLCWNQTLRKNLQEKNFPLESFDLLEIRKAAVNLYENAQTNRQNVRSGLLALRLANSYTGLAVVQSELEEKPVSRSAAFQHYLSAYESEDSTEDEKIQALRGAVNTLDALQKLDEQDPVTSDETVFVLLSDQINRMRVVAKESAGKVNATLDDLKTIAAFANAVWVIGDSETVKSTNTILLSYKSAYEESISFYRFIAHQTTLSSIAGLNDKNERDEHLKVGLDARIWLLNIKQDVGFPKLKLVTKEELKFPYEDLYEFNEYVKMEFPNPNSDIQSQIELAHLLFCEYFYSVSDFEAGVDIVDMYFGDKFDTLTKETPETKITQIVALAHHYKILCLYNLGRFEELLTVSEKLLALDVKHVFPSARIDFWAERQKFYSWALNGLDRSEESIKYRAYLGESFPEKFPEYVDTAQMHKLMNEINNSIKKQ